MRSARTLVTSGHVRASRGEQCASVTRIASVPSPDCLGDDHIDQSGFVLEAEEGDAAGAGWSLPAGDDAADEDAGVVIEFGEPPGRYNAKGVEAVANECAGVVVAGDAGVTRDHRLVAYNVSRETRRITSSISRTLVVGDRRHVSPAFAEVLVTSG